MSQTIVPGRTQEIVVSQLDTYNHTAMNAGNYTVSVSINEIPPSSISVVIQLNLVTKATSIAPSATQELIQLQQVIDCAVNDVISVIISSSNPAEALPNIFKGQINLRYGLS